MAAQAITIGALSRRTGCKIETIRYYERIGVVPAPARKGRYRSYDPNDVARLSFVRRARELGFSLEEVRALLALSGETGGHCAEARDLAASHLKDVRDRIADLRRMEKVLATSVEACDTGQNLRCPLMDTLNSQTSA